MFLVLFPEASPFRDAGHSVHSSVLLVQLNCPLQIMKEMSTLEKNFATEAKKNKLLVLFVQTYQKSKEVPYMEMSRDNDQKRKKSPSMEMSRDNDQKRKNSFYMEKSHDID